MLRASRLCVRRMRERGITFLVEKPAAGHAAGEVADASPVGEQGQLGLVPGREGRQGGAGYRAPGVPHAALRAQQGAE